MYGIDGVFALQVSVPAENWKKLCYGMFPQLKYV